MIEQLMSLSPIDLLLYLFVAVVLVITIVVEYRMWIQKKHSERTKKSITQMLKKMSGIREWKVLTDREFSDDKSSGSADQVVVGPFGVLMVKDLHRAGGYYGDLDAEEWVVTDANQDQAAHFREKIASPLLECRRAADVVRRRLIKGGLTNVNVHSVAVTTQRRTEVYIPGGADQVMTKNALKALLDTDRYKKDRGVNVSRVLELIDQP